MTKDGRYPGWITGGCFVGVPHTKAGPLSPKSWTKETRRCGRHTWSERKLSTGSVRRVQYWAMASGPADTDSTEGSRGGAEGTARSAQTSASVPAPSEASAVEATSGFQGSEKEAGEEGEEESYEGDYEDIFEDEVPGKIVLSEQELAEQRQALERYSELLRKDRLRTEAEASRLFGFVRFAETLNGRLAMFFFVTGLLTEYWTDYSIPQQIELLLRTLGVI